MAFRTRTARLYDFWAGSVSDLCVHILGLEVKAAVGCSRACKDAVDDTCTADLASVAGSAEARESEYDEDGSRVMRHCDEAVVAKYVRQQCTYSTNMESVSMKRVVGARTYHGLLGQVLRDIES
jgi:hypothetical protein